MPSRDYARVGTAKYRVNGLGFVAPAWSNRTGFELKRMSRSISVRFLLVGAFVMSGVAMTQHADAAEISEPRNVLAIFTDEPTLPANIEAERTLRQTVGHNTHHPIDLFAEFLDEPHFSGPAYDATMSRYLREKYASRPPYVIVAVGEQTLPFLLRNRMKLFAGVPIVYVGMQKTALRTLQPLPDDVVGVPVEYDFYGTLEQALRFHPRASRLVIITGAHAWDRRNLAKLREDVRRLDLKVPVAFWSELSMAEMLRRVAAIPADAIVFSTGFQNDATGTVFKPRDVIERIAAASKAPVYGPYNTFIGTGIVGGMVPSFVQMAHQAGVFTNDLIDGATPRTMNVPSVVPTQLMLDWRQVRRFGIDEALIPADADVQFKEPTFWETYGELIMVAAAVITLQGIMIAALLHERRLQRRTAAALEATERRMILAGRTARLSNWAWDLGADSSRRANGASVPAELHAPISKEPLLVDFDVVLEATHPADRDRLARAARNAVANDDELEAEYRAIYPNAVRWFAIRGRADANTQQLRGVALDITERKTAELRAAEDQTALQHITRVSLLGQLSASIAHQLNQPLAAILNNAEAAQKMLGHERPDLHELKAICDDIVADDHRAADVIRRLGALFKRGDPETSLIDVNALVLETLELVNTDLVRRHVIASVDLSSRPTRIEGERVQLQQVLLNMIVNAADAMKNVDAVKRTLVVRTEVVDDGVSVSVIDRGSGIAESNLPNIFDAFWSTKQGGMGIGLAICRSIVKSHGGALSAVNNVDGGATFTAMFPTGTRDGH